MDNKQRRKEAERRYALEKIDNAEIERIAEIRKAEYARGFSEGCERLFMALSELANAKDVVENGVNEPMKSRSLHATTLTMNEILRAHNVVASPYMISINGSDHFIASAEF